MQNIEEYKGIFEAVIERSKRENASAALKKYLLSLDYKNIQVIQVAMYLGQDEEELKRTKNLEEKLDFEIKETDWNPNKGIEALQIYDKGEGKDVGEALERVMNKFF